MTGAIRIAEQSDGLPRFFNLRNFDNERWLIGPTCIIVEHNEIACVFFGNAKVMLTMQRFFETPRLCLRCSVSSKRQGYAYDAAFLRNAKVMLTMQRFFETP
ncbi:hypothetical protein KZ483_21405 [Paenibacillus sp. sptzw28]|uniref:hypothetical protein n=1 Tax=Paenibacillus sp. sptzw28 TaxID=715179 RepID=UPI001C6EB3B6|nr:hypothetical protein [Paenibacillus sp. sptzw28]QYR20349.1 hypothetical protein KZ483_21405 [Paenibacillus sp. sptzw28]